MWDVRGGIADFELRIAEGIEHGAWSKNKVKKQLIMVND